MKILLVNPEQEADIDSNLPKFVDQARGSLPPLGLLYVGASAKIAGHDVRVADCSIGDDVVKTIANFDPDVVGITATTFTLLKALRLARTVKQASTARIVLGGVHASIFPQETIQNCPDIDYALSGEGEKCFPELLKGIQDGTAGKRGIAKSDGFIENLDELPMPDRRLTDWRKYKSAVDGTGYITTVMTSRGCPVGGVFCHRPHMGKRFRARSADNVMAELDSIREMGIGEVTFYDDTFAVNRDRVVKICERLVKGNYKLKWDMRTRVDLVDLELLKLLKKAGCKQIRYGVESSSDRILEQIGKGITLERAEQAIKWSREAGIGTLTYFIIGSPGESEEDWERTIRFSKKLNPDYCYFAIMTPYPATPLYDKWLAGAENQERGKRVDHWQDFACNPREIDTPYYQDWVEREHLEYMLRKAYKKFYLRPGYLIRKGLQVRSLGELVRGFRAVIGIHG